MRKINVLLSTFGMLAVVAVAQSQKAGKTQDEQQLRTIEAETGKFEQQNDSSKMDLLADLGFSPELQRSCRRKSLKTT